jgi:hypothetical protein
MWARGTSFNSQKAANLLTEQLSKLSTHEVYNHCLLANKSLILTEAKAMISFKTNSLNGINCTEALRLSISKLLSATHLHQYISYPLRIYCTAQYSLVEIMI